MRPAEGVPGHLDDGALVRVLDGEASTAEFEHAGTCGACRERLGRLDDRAARLTERLVEADGAPGAPQWDPTFLDRIGVGTARGASGETPPGAPPVPPPAGHAEAARAPGHPSPSAWRVSPTVLRWAAAVAVLSGAVAVPPVRALLVDAAATLRSFVSGGGTVSPGTAPSDDPSAVEVAVDGPVLTIAVGADVTIRLVPGGTGPRATARLEGGAPGAEILVRTDGFTVTGGGAGAVLEIRVPAGVVRVRIDGGSGRLRDIAAPRDSAVTVPPGA